MNKDQYTELNKISVRDIFYDIRFKINAELDDLRNKRNNVQSIDEEEEYDYLISQKFRIRRGLTDAYFFNK